VHIVPAAGVQLDTTGSGKSAGQGIATAALQTVGRLDEDVDLILLAVPAGEAQAFVEQLLVNGQALAA